MATLRTFEIERRLILMSLKGMRVKERKKEKERITRSDGTSGKAMLIEY